MSDSETGDYYIGRYRVQGTINSGGFGTVLKGRDDELKRDVAIKIPKVATQSQLASFRKEGQILAKLRHDHIVRIFDIGSTEKWPCYIVSEYIDGCDLREFIKTRKLSLLDATHLTSCIAKALYHAHQMGLVHRDVKPANILIGKNEHPFLADFGLALSEFASFSELAGTATYMSPEQAAGGKIDHRSDIYSLGTVLFELLVGRTPFVAATKVEMVTKISSLSLPAIIPNRVLRWLPPELARILLKALEKRVENRYSSAAEFYRDLDAFLVECKEDSVVSSKLSSRRVTLYDPVGPLRSRRGVIGTLFTIGGLVCAFTAFSIWKGPSKLLANAILETNNGTPILAYEDLVSANKFNTWTDGLKQTVSDIKPDAILPSGTPISILSMPDGAMSTVERLVNGEISIETLSQDIDRNMSARVKVLSGDHANRVYWVYAAHVKQVPTFEVSSP